MLTLGKPLPVLDLFQTIEEECSMRYRESIINYYIKDDQYIYGVLPLSHQDSYEGALTYAEGRSFAHVDAGLIICDTEPDMNRCPYSWVQVERPRLAMAAVLNALFPTWEVEEPKVNVHWTTRVGPNTSIGHAGFGRVWTGTNWIKFPQLGKVRILRDGSIGSGCTIPRGALSDTVIGQNTHLDDQVHIGHGSVVGHHVIIAANAMLSGSVTVEDYAWIGPSASIMQGVTIGEGATIGLGAVVLKDVAPGETIVAHHRVISTKDRQLGVTR